MYLRYLLPILMLSLFGLARLDYKRSVPPRQAANLTGAPLSEARQLYSVQLDEFIQAVARYHRTAETTNNPQRLRTAHYEARLAFKEVEWLLAHLDEGGVNRHLNGAPLPKVEQHVADLRVIKPSGFQRLEELVYEEAPDTAAIVSLTRKLLTGSQLLSGLQNAERLTHANVWAAARYGLIRVYTLGLTGFDTPASDAALEESARALSSMRHTLSVYFDGLDKPQRRQLDQLFTTGIEQLQNGDFDNFDRLNFYRDVLHPLYAGLLTAQRRLHIDTPAESGERPRTHNYAATDLFADNFLNDYVFAGQPPVDPYFADKKELGKKLFYDTRLSSSGTLSCASCHHPDKGFTDGERTSMGAQGAPLLRNAPTLIGAVYAERYFADMREPQLSRQIRHVIQEHNEFDTDYLEIMNKLRADEDYRLAFGRAYRDIDSTYHISAYSIGDALASYVRTLHANDSPVDHYLRGESDQLAASVQRGYNLFMGKAACGTCHFAPTFAGLVPPYYRESESEVLGITTHWPVNADHPAELDGDLGRVASGRPLDGVDFYAFSFKTPTVRNAALTAPYMHNGSIADLAAVVDFYNVGGGAGAGLEVPHQTLPFDNLQLTEAEQRDLVAFMEALTDQTDWKEK